MKKKTTVTIISIIISALAILSVLCGLYLRCENTKLQVSSYDIVNGKIPCDFNNYKIVQVSDFHNTKSKTLTYDLIKQIENLNPNIIVLTGDLIDSNKTDIAVAIDLVKQIKGIAPIYFISGNHEAKIKSYSSVKEKLEENGVFILDNKVEAFKINGSEINLIGIDDPQMASESSVSEALIAKTELETVRYNKNNYSILLSHRPELINVYAEYEMDLVLSGHAHGGQIRLPFIGGIVAPNQGLFPKYTAGIYENNKTTMVVSRGIGNSILPFRINNRPELVNITLKTSQ